MKRFVLSCLMPLPFAALGLAQTSEPFTTVKVATSSTPGSATTEVVVPRVPLFGTRFFGGSTNPDDCLVAQGDKYTTFAPGHCYGHDVTKFAGADIGAQANAAIAYVTSQANYNGGRVFIPEGTYAQTTQIVVPNGIRLEMSPGVVLNYSGSACSIDINSSPANAPGNSGTGVEGFDRATINGTAAGACGVKVDPLNFGYVRGVRALGFSNGYGIWNNGANHVEIANNNLNTNKYGLYVTPGTTFQGCFDSNALYVHNNEISSNQWGVWSDVGCGTESLGNQYRENTLEGNAKGSMYLNWERGTSVIGNYFEDNVPIAVQVGKANNVWMFTAKNNYFTTTALGEAFELGYGVGFDIADNAELSGGTTSGCFVNINPGGNGGNGGVKGFGLNAAGLGFGSKYEFCAQGIQTLGIGPGTFSTLGVGGHTVVLNSNGTVTWQ